MLNELLNAQSTVTSQSFSASEFFVSTIAALALGLVIAVVYMFRNPQYSKNLVMTLVLMPAMVQMVIALVNDNVGAGMAVLGAFSLVRFRSVPGNAREIASIFMAMVVGLGVGMGAFVASILFTLVVGAFSAALVCSPFGASGGHTKDLRVTVPEDVDYEHAFKEVFAVYSERSELIKVRTTNLGSLFELYYQVRLKPGVSEKSFLDDLRVRNGNLNIVYGHIVDKETL